ncbi:MAG TPA: hypothetical protein VF974_00150 [Patescibacteria group bacterium]
MIKPTIKMSSDTKNYMVTPELQAYISQSRASGISDSEIRQTLLSQGWNQPDVDSALGSGSSQSAAVPSPNSGAPVKGEKDLIWGLLLPIISFGLVTLNNILVLNYIAKNGAQSGGQFQLLGSLTILMVFIVWLFPIISWFLIGRGVARYSKEKGYGAGLGWVLGLILSFLGLLIMALLPKRDSNGHPEKILTRRVIILFVTLWVVLILAIVFAVYKGKKNMSSTGQSSNQTIESTNPQYANATLPAATDKSTWTNFSGSNYGVTFSYPANLFDVYDSLSKCGIGTCPTFTQYTTIGNKRYWFAGMFAGQGKAGSMNVSLLLDYNDISKVPVTQLFGSGTLTPVTVGNKSGNQLILNKNGCTQIYYFVPGGTIIAPSNLGQGHNGNNIVVINFDGCTTGMAVNNNQNYINSILSTFSIN